jgi:hypothetical protein
MDHKTNDKGPSITEGRAMKVGDKVWVLCEVHEIAAGEIKVQGVLGGSCFWVTDEDCKPVEPEAVEQVDHIPFKVGDPVVSWDGRKGIVEAINLIAEFPITVRHSMREQVSYKLGGVKRDQTTQAPDPVNPSHYKQGPAETIDIIEAAIAKAPSNKAAGLHWQVLKYVLRCWLKNGIEDLKKAKWYLDRLIHSFEANEPVEQSKAQLNSDTIPEGYRKLKDSSIEPRDLEDLRWSVSEKRYVELTVDEIVYANRDNWAACRREETK